MRFETGEGDTISFIDSRYKQSKNRNLNSRFTSGKEYRIASTIKTYFQFSFVQGILRDQSPKIIVINFSSCLTICIRFYKARVQK